MALNIEFTTKAVKDISKLEDSTKRKIFEVIESLPIAYIQLDIKKLKGTDTFRLRVGDYRIIFAKITHTIVILEVMHRKDIYKKK